MLYFKHELFTKCQCLYYYVVIFRPVTCNARKKSLMTFCIQLLKNSISLETLMSLY